LTSKQLQQDLVLNFSVFWKFFPSFPGFPVKKLFSGAWKKRFFLSIPFFFYLLLNISKELIMARITQGCFSLLPDLTNAQIKKQVEYAINCGYAVSIEYTDDPHPRNSYWEMWGLPLFDVPDSAAILYELAECRRANPGVYIKINAFNNARGVESAAISFIVDRPAFEPGFYLVRQEGKGRQINYTIQSYAVQAGGEGSRY